MKVLVCGGREYDEPATIELVLNTVHFMEPITELIHGDAGKTYLPGTDAEFVVGADKQAGDWATIRGITVWACPANWQTHGRAAGPIRNQAMLDFHKPDLVVAFPGGRGTTLMCNMARKAGVKVYQVNGET